MEASALVVEYEARGVQFSLQDGQVRFDAGSDPLSREDVERLRSQRNEIVGYLRSREAQLREMRAQYDAVELWTPTPPQNFIVNHTPTHHIHLLFRLPGNFDVGALQVAIDRCVERHMVLRTSYVRDEGQRLLAVTRRHLCCPVEIERVPASPGDADEKAAQSRAAEIVREPFDLQNGPLLRFVVLEGPARGPVLIFVVQHSIFDAWSGVVLFDEISKMYVATSAHGEPDLIPVECQFPQWARERNAWVKSNACREQLNFWRRSLEEVRTPFTLPADRQMPVDDDDYSPPTECAVSGKVAKMIRSLAGKERTTSAIWILTAYCMLLARWSGSEDVCIWVLDARRTEPRHLRTVGLLANQWLLCVRLPRGGSHREAVKIVQDAYARALPHCGVPPRMVEPVLEESIGGPLPPAILFNFISALPAPGGAPLTEGPFQRLNWPVRTGRLNAASKYVLSTTFLESDFGIAWTMQHKASLLEDATVQRYSEELADILFESTEERSGVTQE